MQYQIQLIRQHFSSIDSKFRPLPAFTITRQLFACRSLSPSFYKMRSQTITEPRLSQRFTKVYSTYTTSERGSMNQPNNLQKSKLYKTNIQPVSQQDVNNNSQSSIRQVENKSTPIFSPFKQEQKKSTKEQQEQNKQKFIQQQKQEEQQQSQNHRLFNHTEAQKDINKSEEPQKSNEVKKSNEVQKVNNQESVRATPKKQEINIEKPSPAFNKLNMAKVYQNKTTPKSGSNRYIESSNQEEKTDREVSNRVHTPDKEQNLPDISYEQQSQPQSQLELKLYACERQQAKKSTKKSKSPKKQHVIYYNQIYLYKPRSSKQNSSKISYTSSMKQISPHKQSRQISYILTTPSKRNTRAPLQPEDDIEVINLAPEFSKLI